MTRSRLPLVSDDHLLGLDGASEQLAPVVVGSDAWYTWLADQQIQSFSFRNRLGTFTARRERKRHGWYWYAYRKRAGRLRKAYLGKTEELTLVRLNAVAATLIGQVNNDEGSQAHPDAPGGGALQVSSDTVDDKEEFFLAPTSALTYPAEPGQAGKHNLPAQLTPLIGREQEVEAVCALLRQPAVRLLTLTGTGGVGKTRLGLQIATDLVQDFADGACFVSLAPISDPDLVLPTIAQTLGLQELGDQPLLEHLTASLHEKCLLLFLDNFEQVMDAAPVLTALLRTCPSLKVLVTSREVLRVHGEQVFPVLPLALPNLAHFPGPEAVSQYAAVTLFLQRVHSVEPDFQLTAANVRTIAAICIHLDGLPLALELAAARLRLLSPQALLARLEHRLALLTQGPRDVYTRQQTLRNTLQWSYDLLNAQEQRLFRRLAVFVGGCTLKAVEAVCKALGDELLNVLDGVASLLDKNLLHQQRTPGNGEPRLMMLETIREYGLEALAEGRELELTQRAHANYYLALAEEAEPELEGPQQTTWLEQLEREHGNLRAAMRWSLEREEAGQDTEDERQMALRFGIVLRNFWIIHGHWSEGRNFLERALAVSDGTVSVTRAKVLEAAAGLAIYQIDYDRGEALCRESLALYRERGDKVGTAYSLSLLGTLAWQRGDFAIARALMEETLALSKEVNDKEAIASLLSILAELATQQGEYTKAHALLEESLAMYRDLGNARDLAISLRALALTLFVSQGDSARVRLLLEESLMLARELGDKADIARCLSHAALVALQQGEAATARVLAEESIALHRETGDRWGISWLLSILARVEACQGEHTAALGLYEESLAGARKIGSKLIIAFCLEGMASVLATQGEPKQAVRLWGAAAALRESMGAPIWPVERASYERLVAIVRAQLGEAPFAVLWTEGRTMLPEQAFAVQGSAAIPTPLPAGQPSAPAAKSSATAPAGLTRRESEVIHLLAIGLTNTQIAEQLVISLSTVNTHVRSIYTKLDVPSRSAATRYAIEHHLV